MKKKAFFSALLFLCLSFSLFAQVSRGWYYQAIVRDGTELFKNTLIKARFTLLKGSLNGDIAYVEEDTVTTNKYGLISLQLGHGQAIQGMFDLIDWNKDRYFLKVEIDLQGGNGVYKDFGTREILFQPDAEKNWFNAGDTVLYTLFKKVGIGGSDLLGTLQIVDQGNPTDLIVGDHHSGNTYLRLSTTAPENGLGEIQCVKSSGSVYGDLILNPNGGNVGVGTADPQRQLDVNGVTRSQCVEITGGCDIVEKINSLENLEPGDVIVFDLNNPGQVIKSRKAYDRMAIGVVSGAGGINHGIMLSQEGLLDGNISFAIAGRVNVKVVGNIKPGDLLTTSEVPGYAMSAKNKRKRDGAIIGKALSIPDDQGLVLMLVNTR